MKTIFLFLIPESLYPCNAGEHELGIMADLPFRPHIMDLVFPANLLYGAEQVVNSEIMDYFFDGKQYMVTDITILKDDQGEYFLECFCEPASNFEMDEGVDFFLGEN